MRRIASPWLGVLALLLVSCGPAGQATPGSTPTLPPRTTASTLAATSTPMPTGVALPPATTLPTPKSTPTPTAVPATQPQYGGILRASSYLDPTSWDPYFYHGSYNHRQLNLMYVRLFTYRYGPPLCNLFPVDGDLAKSWSWVDDVTLDVKLRDDVRFQKAAPVNGRGVVAEDVVRSLGDMYARLTAAKSAGDNLSSITALDQYTVRFKLKSAQAEFVESSLAKQFAEILAPEVNTPKKVWTWKDHVWTANGPFVLKDFRPGVRIDLERNPDYYRPELPYLDGVKIAIVPDEATTGAMIRTGQVDAVQLRDMGVQNYIATKATGVNLQMCAYPASHVVYMRTDKPPFNDVRVRRALSMAIDRDVFNKTVWLGLGIPKLSPVRRGQGDWMMELADYPADVRQYVEYNPDKARALLADAGYAGGLEFPLVYDTAAAGARAVAESLSAFWQGVGVRAALKPLLAGEYSGQVVNRRDYEAAANSWASSVTLEETLFSYFHSASASNRSRVNDPKLDEMLASQRKLFDMAQRREVVRAIQVYLVDRQYRLELPEMTRPLALQPNVNNVWYKTDGYSETEFLRFAWLAR